MPKRLYTMPVTDLQIHARTICALIEEDLPLFAGIGITAADVENFGTLIQKALKIERDEHQRQRSGDTNKQAVKLYKIMTTKARMFPIALAFHYGAGAQPVAELSATGMTVNNQEESLQRAREILARLTQLLPDLPANSISQANLDDFSAAIEAYSAARKNYLAEKTSRSPTANTRVAANNAIHLELLRLTSVCRPVLLANGRTERAKKMKVVPDEYLSLLKRRKTLRNNKKNK